MEVLVTTHSGTGEQGGQSGSGNGRPQIDELVADLGSPDRGTRENARESLVAIGVPAVDALVETLAHQEPHLRWEAAKALQQIADPAVAPAMITALEHDDQGVRWIAAETLAALGRAGVIPLLKALVDGSDSVRLRDGAHRVLSHTTDTKLREATAPVLAALDDAEPMVGAPVAAYHALTALDR
jgi:HEAT repeat protein